MFTAQVIIDVRSVLLSCFKALRLFVSGLAGLAELETLVAPPVSGTIEMMEPSPGS